MTINQFNEPIQGEKTTIQRQCSKTAGIAGLLFPGGGQLVRFRPLSALFVLVGTLVPIFWTAVLINQLINDRVLAPAGEPRAGILEGVFWTRFGELKGMPPELGGLLLLGFAVYAVGAWMAYKE